MSLSKERVEIRLDQINPGKNQARIRDTEVDKNDDLVASIRRNGLINPIMVRKLPNGKYDLISGQRRYKAYEHLRKPTIAAYVIGDDVNRFDAKRISLAENTARKDMKRADYVDAIQMFMDRYGSTKTVAEELGLSTPTVRKYLHIGRLPKKIQEAIEEKIIFADDAIKALDALGGDESAVDLQHLLETAKAMKSLSLPQKKTFATIKKNKPDLPLRDVIKKAKQWTEVNKFTIIVNADQLFRINTFKTSKDIKKTEDAAIELIDMGLRAAEL